MHRVLELKLEQRTKNKPIMTVQVQCSNEIAKNIKNMGRKFGGLRPFFGEGAGSLSNTNSAGLMPTSIPSGILTHLAVSSQYKWAENWGGGSAPFLGMGWVPI